VGAPKSGKGRTVDATGVGDKLTVRRGIMDAEAALRGQELSPWMFASPSDDSRPVDAAFIR
jgi:hypothetical protein